MPGNGRSWGDSPGRRHPGKPQRSAASGCCSAGSECRSAGPCHSLEESCVGEAVSAVSAALQAGRAHGAGVRPVGQLVPCRSQWREGAQPEWKGPGTPAVAEVPLSPPLLVLQTFLLKDSIKIEGRRERDLSSISLLPHQQKASLNSTLIRIEQTPCPSHHTALNDLQQMCIGRKVTALVLLTAGETTRVLVFFGGSIPHRNGVKQAQSLLAAQFVQREQRSSSCRAGAKQKQTRRREQARSLTSVPETWFKSPMWGPSSRALFRSGRLLRLFPHI